MLKLIRRIIIYGIVIYLILLGIFYFLQRQYIYFPRPGDISPKKWGLPKVKLIKLRTSDKLQLSAWYSPAKNKSMPTLVYFHGNYGHMAQRAFVIKPYIHAGYGVFMLSYRGYSGSEGRPSEQGLYRDGRASINFLKSHGVKTRCMALLAVSLGTGVAVQIATEYHVGALILQSSYTSLADIAKKHYPIFPVDLMLKDRYDSYQKIEKIKAPILFIHGKQDRIIPYDLGYRLYLKASSPKQLQTYPNSGHNNMPDSSKLIIQFLKKYKIHC